MYKSLEILIGQVCLKAASLMMMYNLFGWHRNNLYLYSLSVPLSVHSKSGRYGANYLYLYMKRYIH